MQVGLKLVGARDLKLSSTKAKNKAGVGNGLLYYRHVEGDVPVAKFPDKEYALDVMEDSETKNLPVQNGEKHYVAWVANSGEESDEGFDRDFFLLYELLDQTVTRYVPVIKVPETKIAAEFDRLTPPGQCMISYAFGPAEQ